MKPLSSQNIESELSYAYVHAVAAHTGVACGQATRHADNAGIDATLLAYGPFKGGGYLTEVTLNVQLKATIQKPVKTEKGLAYSLAGLSQYDDLRSLTIGVPRILVVLFLPKERADWLTHTEDELILKKCAYWVSLRGAPESANTTAQTIYLPENQKFNPSGLQTLLSRLSHRDIPTYQEIRQ